MAGKGAFQSHAKVRRQRYAAKSAAEAKSDASTNRREEYEQVK